MKKYLLSSLLGIISVAMPVIAADILDTVEAMPGNKPIQSQEEITAVEDPYYIMNSANLNTMNSYIIPAEININPEKYPDYQYILKDGTLQPNFDHQEQSGIFVHIMSTYPGYIIMWFLFLLLWYFGVYRKNTNFSQVFKIAFEGIWNFFEGILGEHRQHWIKMYVVTLFFVILISNLFGVINDIVRFFAPQYLRWVTAPTGEFESNIALAIISIAVTLYAQAKALGGWHKLAHEFVPITGKGLVDGKGPIAKGGDILISMFTGFLDIIGTVAKIISLSIRLLGNMSSGSILLNVIFIGIGMLTVGLVGFNLQLGLPIIVYIQSLLGSVIQAFVFALLVGIGIMMAQGD